ncbi:MAG: DUF1838 family protein [Rhodospirillaceae bacterium]|nr:DUF1838 family protein [Rhodospirillaceae bacterium]MBT6962214.1 DUF1838 family protein [Rhodospirillaceae bacterium]
MVRGYTSGPLTNRRAALKGSVAAALSAALAAPARAATAPLSADPATWTDDERVWAVARQAGAVTEQKIIWRTRGVLYAFQYPDSPIPLVRFKGCEQQWWRPQADGSFLRTKSFLTFFTDYETDEMLEEFTNPLTGETSRPSPNFNRVPDGQVLSKRGWSHNIIEKIFPDYYDQFSIRDIEINVIADSVSFHSKVNWPEPLVRRPYNQNNTHFVRLADLMNPDMTWVPSHGAGQILMPEMPNVGMTDPAMGQVLWHVEYYKMPSLDGLPQDYLERATAEYDNFATDPIDDTGESRLERRLKRAGVWKD